MTSDVRDGAKLSEAERRVLVLIDEAAWLGLACALIPAGQPEAENPLDPDEPAGREEGAALFVAEILRGMDIAVELVTKRPGRPNVVGVLQGTDPAAPSLTRGSLADGTLGTGFGRSGNRTAQDRYMVETGLTF